MTNPTMTALIVDDERLARLDLRHVLAAHTDVEIVGEAVNATEAEAQIQALKPDVVFLDIRMPDGSGFDLLERLENSPIVVFTTAYDEYALKAFEVNALDYLLKPIAADRLQAALERVRMRLREQSENGVATDSPSKTVLQADSRVFLRDGDKCLFVKVADILSIRVDGRYVEVKCYRENRALEKLLLMRSLESLEERLPSALFFRASRNELVNMNRITSVEAWFGGAMLVTLEDGTRVEISRRQAQKFKEMMSL
ncbi:MAG: LytR/AlgR family response regulator transcription factor [Candidatus Kapaibacteriota bacterium]